MTISKFTSSALLIILSSTIFLGCSKKDKKEFQSEAFQISMSSEPHTLNPFTYNDAYAGTIHEYVLGTLMFRDPDTYKLVPRLAEKHEISKDGLSFTFQLRKGVKWHDDKPLTVEDVKFSYDAMMDDRYKAMRLRPYFENIKAAEVVDENTIKFTVKKKYFGNFDVIAEMSIVPKHIYIDPEKKVNRTLIGTGPYSLKHGSYDRAKSITLKSNKDWWGHKDPYFKNFFRFPAVKFRFIKEENIELEMIKKGLVDLVSLTPEAYVKKTSGKVWDKKLTKVKTQNQGPRGYGFVGWNLKKKIFQDKGVRIALSHLMNRELMIKKFLENMSLMATGPWYQQSPYANPDVKAIKFSPEKAKQLLTAAGWTDSDKDGVLDKVIDGKKTDFKFELMWPSRDFEKYFTIYKEDLKKAGIHMDLKLVEWNTFVAALDDRKFDAVSLAWSGGSVDNDPKQIWHTESIRGGGSNFISYSNSEVDKLIDQGRLELNRDKRIVIFKKIYKKIAEDAPYVFLFNRKFSLYAHNNRIEKPKDTFNYEIGSKAWSMKKDIQK